MMNFFEHCADIASVGIIVDFTEDTETYILYYLFLFSKFKLCQRDLHKKSGCPLRATTIVQKNILRSPLKTLFE